jgi:ATPase subunit of ABC transporter with duplicated ATPase domains
LDGESHRLGAYPGNYSDYLEAKLAEREQQWSAWRDQQMEIRRMKQDITRTKGQSLKVEQSTTPRQPGVRRPRQVLGQRQSDAAGDGAG